MNNNLEDWKKALKAAYVVEADGTVIGLNGTILFTTDEIEWEKLSRSRMWRWVDQKYPEFAKKYLEKIPGIY